MKFVMLIHPRGAPTPESREWEQVPEEERRAAYLGYEAIRETPGVTPGFRLHPPEAATTVRVREGELLVTDGPFVSAKEALGGFLVFDTESLDAAIELAARIPTAQRGGAIEIRPVEPA
jgi:hypothetical protein